MKQKILAILLSVVMLLGVLPVGIIAGAADGNSAEKTLPAGTVGYVMDVPETEQYISSKVNGIRCFGYSSYMFMKNTAANAADPFSDSVSDYISDGDGGAYVRIIDGEEFLIVNPAEVSTADYTTSNRIDTNTTTDAETGNTTTVDNTVVSTTTDVTANSGKLYRFLGQYFFNGISAIENTSITADVTGLPLVDDDKESSITHVAFRIKVIGGHPDQMSVMYEPNGTTLGFNTNYGGIYFVDANTGKITTNEKTDVVVLPRGDFDGYMVVPTTTARLQAANHMYLYTYGATSDYYRQSDWSGRVFCIGDTYAVNDADAFAAQFKPQKVAAPADTSKNILTVPTPGINGYISYNDSTGGGNEGTGYYFGMTRYNDPVLFTSARSEEVDGEYFFTTEYPEDKRAKSGSYNYYLTLFLPATYELNAKFETHKALGELHTDAADYGYVAMRFKTTGGTEGASSKFGLSVSNGGVDAIDLAGVVMINYTDGTTTTLTAGKEVTVPYDFDGWFIVPESKFISGISTEAVKRVGYVWYPDADGTFGSWVGKKLHFGDMKIFKDYDAFAKANGMPTFTVNASTDDLEIINEADTNKEVLYSLDQKTWMNIDEINALTYEAETKYTIYAKYAWSNVASTEVWTSPYSTHLGDTASYYMNIPDYPTQLKKADGYFGWSEKLPMEASRDPFAANSNANTADGYQSNDSGVLNVVADEYGETFMIFNPREVVNANDKVEDANVYINNIKFGNNEADPKGLPEGVALADQTHWALRIKLTGGVPGQESTFSFYINGTYGFIWPQNAKLIDYKTGEVRDAGGWSGNGFAFTDEFDGWIVIPTASISSAARSYFFEEGTSFQFWTHDAACDHGGVASGSSWENNRILWFGDFVVLSNYDKFVEARLDCANTGRHYITALNAKAPSAEDNGYAAHYGCRICGKAYADAEGAIECNPANLALDSASLTLEQNIGVNFKANAENLAAFTNVYAKFTFDNFTDIVEASGLVDGKYVFNFDAIGPHNFGKTITAQLFGTYEGVEYAGEEITYSVKDYCYNKLDEYADATDKNEFKTLLVDLLNYGAKAQLYSNTDVTELVSDELGYLNTLYRTLAAGSLEGGTKGIYDDLDDASTLANWKGVNLYFEDKVSLKFRFEIASTEGVTVKVTDAKENGNVIAEISEFVGAANGSYIALFDGLNATEMRKTVYVAVYKDGVKVSDTLAYDIVSYAKQIITTDYISKIVTTTNDADGAQIKTDTSWPSDPNAKLKVLLAYMLRYGDAAAAYAAANA